MKKLNEEFKYKDKIVEFHAVNGIAHGSSKFTTTHVTSSGGGGYIGPTTGFIDPVKIQSHNVIHGNFWIVPDGANEVQIQFDGHNLSVRDGQNVTALFASRSDSEKLILSSIYNNSTGEIYDFRTPRQIYKDLMISNITNKIYAYAISFPVVYIFVAIALLSVMPPDVRSSALPYYIEKGDIFPTYIGIDSTFIMVVFFITLFLNIFFSGIFSFLASKSSVEKFKNSLFRAKLEAKEIVEVN